MPKSAQHRNDYVVVCDVMSNPWLQLAVLPWAWWESRRCAFRFALHASSHAYPTTYGYLEKQCKPALSLIGCTPAGFVWAFTKSFRYKRTQRRRVKAPAPLLEGLSRTSSLIPLARGSSLCTKMFNSADHGVSSFDCYWVRAAQYRQPSTRPNWEQLLHNSHLPFQRLRPRW